MLRNQIIYIFMMDMLDLQLCMYEQQQAAAARAMYSFLLVHSLLQSFELVDLGEKIGWGEEISEL